MRVHYPRTPHLPWSPGATADDIRVSNLGGLRGREVVVTEKLDGENTTLYRDGLHARSLDSAHHPSRAWVKALQGRIGASLPSSTRICGENMYAKHSLGYQNLDSYFYGFSVWNNYDDVCLEWDETVSFLRDLGIPTPAVLWRGQFDEKKIRSLRLDPDVQEGYVVRTVDGFERPAFGSRVAKWVRPNHVQTSQHWMQAAVVPNVRGPKAVLWDVRSGAEVEGAVLLNAAGVGDDWESELATTSDTTEAVLQDTMARLNTRLPQGYVRAEVALAALLYGKHRGSVAARLAGGPLGIGFARRVADLVGLQRRLREPFPFPDSQRRAGLARMALAADLESLHALAAGVLADRRGTDGNSVEAKQTLENVELSAYFFETELYEDLCALAQLRLDLRGRFAELELDPAVMHRCWAEVRDAWMGRGYAMEADEAVALTQPWRREGVGLWPQLIQLIGPSGSGKSTFAASLDRFVCGDGPSTYSRVSMDDIREERGARADQRANSEVLDAALQKLSGALAQQSASTVGGRGGQVVWDATGLNKHQRGQVGRIAREFDAATVNAVFLVDELELRRRNATRANPVPADVLTTQLHRYQPPYPGDAHQTWYIGADGTIGDAHGHLSDHSEYEYDAY